MQGLGVRMYMVSSKDNYTVEARKLEHHYPRALKVEALGIPARIVLNQCSNFLGFTIGQPLD